MIVWIVLSAISRHFVRWWRLGSTRSRVCFLSHSLVTFCVHWLFAINTARLVTAMLDLLYITVIRLIIIHNYVSKRPAIRAIRRTLLIIIITWQVPCGRRSPHGALKEYRLVSTCFMHPRVQGLNVMWHSKVSLLHATFNYIHQSFHLTLHSGFHLKEKIQCS